MSFTCPRKARVHPIALSVLVMRMWNYEHYGSLCMLGGTHTHYIASVSFCAQLQKLLNISADGEMLVVGIFYA